MRTRFLLLLLAFSTVTFASKKTYSVTVNAKGISLKSLEKSIRYKQSGVEFNSSSAVLDPTLYITPVDAAFYYQENFLFSEGFFDNTEFSYKNAFENGGGSPIIFEDQTKIQEAVSQDVNTLFLQGMFYGFAAMLVLLNLVCFFLFEEKPFLWYALALTATALLLFFADGLFGLFGWELTQTIPVLQTSLLFVTVGLTALFSTKFLSLKEFAPKLKWATLPILGVAGIAILFQMATQNSAFASVANLSLFSVLFVYFIAGVGLFSRKNYAKFYVIASFIPLLFTFDFFVLNPMGIEFLSTQTIHIKAAVITEMLILTYAIMFRMQAIKEENSLRQVEMRIFLKRQEALTSRQKTEKLVEDVYLENLIMHYDLDGLEIKLLQYISEGKENIKIARKLNTTEAEIEEMTKELYKKLEIGEHIQQDYRIVEQQPDYIYN